MVMGRDVVGAFKIFSAADGGGGTYIIILYDTKHNKWQHKQRVDIDAMYAVWCLIHYQI